MKTSHVIGLVVVSVLITVVIEESRISSIRSAAKIGATTGDPAPGAEPSKQVGNENPDAAPAIRKKPRPDPDPVAAPDEPVAEPEDESMAKTIRKMWDNPAGKSMMNQGVKIAVAMMYEDFIEDLDLEKKESEYFKDLLGREIADQQELGMKLMSASPEEREKLTAELKKRGEETEEAIKEFLNDEEDYKAYTDYKSRMPERQQLAGIRSTMDSKGLTLDEEVEGQLVDAMYRARTESNSADFSGPDAMEELAKGNIVERYEDSWARQQEFLRKETEEILDEKQMAAFQEFQGQMKEMQLMGLKMAEKMFSAEEESPE